ncbi:uncharacterized protein LOC111908619 [Lactuca sativa]|uniref:uncharacterized protein LOC111908619 n=1 Tax=Lactuca sativa TaxID=4236 RepID=UPI000CD88625|nr:uncharacterized protein LOC111908619 [Lactuca sativa]
MQLEDLNTLSFNLSSSIGSTPRIPILFPQDYEVWVLHFEDYVLGLEDHGEKDKMISNVKAMRITRFALPLDTFLLPEWKAVVSTVKPHEQFKTYTLEKLVGIPRSHENEVTKDVKIMFNIGSLDLVAKAKKVAQEDSESDFSNSELTKEEHALMVANPRKFIKKNFGRLTTGTSMETSTQKIQEKRASRTLKRKKTNKRRSCWEILPMIAFTAMEGGDEFGSAEFWPTDFEDDEVRKPKNSGCCVAKSEATGYEGRCLMVSECEKFISKSKEHKSMLKQMFDENDKEHIKFDTVQNFDSLCTKLSSENTFDAENDSEFDKSDMSEIYVEDEIDCLAFVQNEYDPKKMLISENLIEYVRVVENKGSKKTQFSPKTNISKSVNTSKDVKGKKKVVSELDISLEEFEANLKKEKMDFGKKMDEKHKDCIRSKKILVEVNLCDNKMKVISDAQYKSEWYNDIGCSHHVTGRREELMEFRSLKDGGKVKFRNNATGEIKGYGMITNG